MNPVERLHWVLRALASNPLRTGLTGLGLAVGILAVTGLTAIGEGVRRHTLDSFAQFGTRLISVTPGKSSTGGMPGILSSVRPLSLDDAQALRQLPGIEAVVPVVSGTGEVRVGIRSRNTDIHAVGREASEAWRYRVALGRFLPDEDSDQARSYAVLGHKVWLELFGGSNPLGKIVRIGGQRYRVIGVMENKGQLLGIDLDDAVYIPAARGLQLFNRDSLMNIDVVFSAHSSSAATSAAVTQRLIERHSQEDFTLFSQEDMLNSLDRILSVLRSGVAALGGISLIVGGVGVFTIMSIGLQERVAEIGLLRALGATRRAIVRLFLIEAVTLACLGGLAGLLALALLIGLLRLLMPGLPLQLHPEFLLLGLLLSALIGVMAGVRPALRAAALSPVDALRSE